MTVERVVVVVDADRVAARDVRRSYAVLSDGTRIADPSQALSGGCTVGFGFGRPRDLIQDTENDIRAMHEYRGTQGLESLAAEVRAAGTEVTAEELYALPLDVEFTDAGRERIINPPRPPRQPMTWWQQVAMWAVATVLGALRPAWRYDAWRRRSRRRRIWGGLVGWLLPNLAREAMRPGPHRPEPGEPPPDCAARKA